MVEDTGLAARQRLRVAVVTETYPPEVNGVAATVSRVVRGLCERGHELQLLRPRQSQAESAGAGHGLVEVLLRGMPIPRYPDLKLGLPAGATLRKLWTQARPDVVHLVTEGPLGWSALNVATALKIPVVSDFRTNFQAYCAHYGVGWLRKPILGYLRHFHNRAACTMVPTDGMRVELANHGFERLRIVSRGVDTQLFSPSRRSLELRARWGAGPHTPVVICVGRLAAEKNLNLVLEAFDALRMTSPQAKLVLVGDGPEKERLMEARPDVLFAGLRRGEDLAAHYASADLFLFPSVTETFGNVVTEAMASGLAVLAYNRAAAGQLIRHGDSGLLVRSDDAAGFCRAAVRLAGDAVWARSMGAQALQTARSLSWGSIVEAVEDEYRSALTLAKAESVGEWREAVRVA